MNLSDKRIRFGRFALPRLSGLEYLTDPKKSETDYLFVNEPHDGFSMYFETDFPIFTVPESSERPYCLFEVKHPERTIKFFCPEKHKNLDSVVWYFYVELFDRQGEPHRLPGQVRVSPRLLPYHPIKKPPGFMEVLEQVQLAADC